MSKVDLRLQCGMPCSKLEVSTAQHGTLSGAGYLHQSQPELLVLVRSDGRQIADKPGDGHIDRGPTLGDRFNDARGEIGERRQEPHVPRPGFPVSQSSRCPFRDL